MSDIEDIQVAAQRLTSASHVRAMKNVERVSEVDLEKVTYEAMVSRKIADRSLQQSSIYLRPSFVLHPNLRRSGEGWVAQYGDLETYGETPDIAFQEFDDQWVGKDEL